MIEQTEIWIKGEVGLGKILLSTGILFAALCLLIFKSQNELLRGTLFPVIISVLVFSGYGVNLVVNRPRQLQNYRTVYQQNQLEFVQQEQLRTQKLVDGYVRNKVMWLVLIGIGALLAFLMKSDYAKGIGLGIILFGTIAFFVDSFLEHSAKTYHKQLIIEAGEM